MKHDEFIESLKGVDPPKTGDMLLALWYDAKGNWEKSHVIIQDIDSKDAALIHAYLHRKEGDIWNADYWYTRAGEKRKEWSLEEEWEELVKKYISS